MPCLTFWLETRDVHLERTSHILADVVFPLLSETIIKGISLSFIHSIFDRGAWKFYKPVLFSKKHG